MSFKDAVNDALRSALTAAEREPFHTPTFSMGSPTAPLDHAPLVAAELEDIEIRRKQSVAK